MSSLHRMGPSASGEGDSPETAPHTSRSGSTEASGLNAFRDAREIVRLAQCSICSQPLRHPLTLPCGNTLCRGCLPETYARRGISYPAIVNREQGFRCPFLDCAKEHPVADCSVDVILMKIVDTMEEQLWTTKKGRAGVRDVSYPTLGRLVMTYDLVKRRRLSYDEELDYPSHEDNGTDHEVLEVFKAVACTEMECQVCYGLLFDPITTHCGHTFCRKCLQRVLDHSLLCPSCRKSLQMPNVLPAQSSNKRLTEILVGLYPDALTERATAVAMEEKAGTEDDELDTPVFVCTASLPGMPTPLFIFEPRYRLMIRRAWETTKRFGMVLPNRSGINQGDLGQVPFMQCGTMLEIEAMHVYPDGRSHIWTTGVSKFKVRRWGHRDEYLVAKVERLDDIPIAEEEALEVLQTARTGSPQDSLPPWSTASTRQLLQTCHEFVAHMTAISAPWMRENNVAFGPPPDNPASFPYWLASVLPVADEEKYKLITSASVRERLLIVVSWIKRIENHRWFSAPGCVMI